MNPIYDVKPPTIEWLAAAPTILVACTGLVAILIEMFNPKKANNNIILASLFGLLLGALAVVRQFGFEDITTFGGMVTRDSLSLALQFVMIAVCFLTILFSENYLREKRIPFGEFYALILWCTVGGMIMVSTTNLLMLFIGLEVLSIALYVLAGMNRRESKSEESAIKYFLLGAFASGFLLYGISFIYGATGGLDISMIGQAWGKGKDVNALLIFGFGLMLVGMCFKAALAPFHAWTPDVYQGAPTNVTAFMAAGSKVAAVGALARLLDAALPMKDFWFVPLYWIAIFTMTLGNLIAVTQKDVKRVLGYSSIANAGYILVGILSRAQAPDKIGLGTTVFYLVSYALMTVGAFAIITLTAQGGREGTRFEDLNGLWKRAPFAAISLVVLIVSLIGIPPTAGFFGKMMIFQDAVTAGLTPLAIVLAVNSAISIYYYLGIVKAVFVEEPNPEREFAPVSLGLAATCGICAAAVLVLVSFLTPITTFVNGVGR